MSSHRSRIWGTMIFLWVVAAAHAQDVPTLTSPVTDLAGVLPPDERAGIEAELLRYEDSTSNQITVLLIPTLGGEALEDYSLRVVEKNRLGQKGRDNGALLLVAVEDRKVRIEVGYGLEGVLTDAMTRLVIENEIAPRFKLGDYAGGVRQGVRALMQAAAGEYRAEPTSAEGEGIGLGAIILIFILIFVVSRMFRGRGGGRGGGGGILPWIILSQMGGRSSGWGGSSGGGFSGGGGGWSGGGGSFGGGGSSGSW